jgi:hypothetical protein
MSAFGMTRMVMRVFGAVGGEGGADPVLPVGGIYQGKRLGLSLTTYYHA